MLHLTLDDDVFLTQEHYDILYKYLSENEDIENVETNIFFTPDNINKSMLEGFSDDTYTIQIVVVSSVNRNLPLVERCRLIINSEFLFVKKLLTIH